MDTCRSTLDIPALHAAYLAEGFLADPVAPGQPLTYYRKTAADGILLSAAVPNLPEDDSDLFDALEAVHEEAAQALRFLWEESGNPHFEVGSLVMTDADYGTFDGEAICRECGDPLDEDLARYDVEYCRGCAQVKEN